MLRRTALSRTFVPCALLVAPLFVGTGCSSTTLARSEVAPLPFVAEEAAEKIPVDVVVDATIASAYVWRGLLLTDDPVFQPSIDITRQGVNLNVWGNMDLGNANGNERQFNEIDLTLGYGHSFDKITVRAALINYVFPNTAADDTTELLLAADFDVLLSPSVELYFDLDEAGGALYAKVGAGHSFEMEPLSEQVSWSIDIAGSIAFGNEDYHELYFATKESEFSDLFLGAAAPFDFGAGLVVTPFVNFSSILGSKIRDAVNDEDNFVVGVSCSLSM